MDLPYLQYFEVVDGANLKSGDIAAVQGWIHGQVLARTSQDVSQTLAVRDLPSARWGAATPDKATVTIALAFADQAAIDSCRAWLVADYHSDFLGMGADVPIAPFDAWTPGGGTGALFGKAEDALGAIGADALWQRGLDGQSVNVVVFDNGLAAEAFETLGINHPGVGVPAGSKNPLDLLRLAGGWAPQAPPQGMPAVPRPWAAAPDHGSMIGRNLVRVAPRATVWDVPFLPPAIGRLGMFLSEAQACWRRVLTDKQKLYRSGGTGSGDAWVFVNAWGIYDRRAEATPMTPGSYTQDLETGGHPFNRIVKEAAEKHGVDVVFAAGNAGPFAPHWRCGPQDRGPGRGIWGANAHRWALSVGAVRSDGRLAGYSSWGPGAEDSEAPFLLSKLKPDLCAPSNFADAGSAMPFANTGTSAASAIAAGFVAAVRTRFKPPVLDPLTLQQVLRETAWTARVPPGVPLASAATSYDPGMGWGILCGQRVAARLNQLFP